MNTLNVYIHHVISSYTPTSPVSHFATHCRCRQLFRSSTCALITPEVDSVLSERITHFLERAYVLDREGRPESEVPLLRLLSKPMQRELRFARFEGCLRCWDQICRFATTCFFSISMLPSVENQHDFDMPLAIVTYDQGFD